jgi:hypothetical protein
MKLNSSYILFVLFFWIEGSSCKKPEQISPYESFIEPEAYFPCYPSSYWIYLDSNGNEIKVKVDSVYMPYRILTDDTLNDLVYLPRINGEYFYQNYIIFTLGSYLTSNSFNYKDYFKRIVVYNAFENQSIKVENYGDQRYPSSIIEQSTFVEKYDTLYINSKIFTNVIVNSVAKRYSGYNDVYLNANVAFPTYIRYYALGIGLILEKVIDPYPAPDTVITKSIVSYMINK